jgi:hypothetical protein
VAALELGRRLNKLASISLNNIINPTPANRKHPNAARQSIRNIRNPTTLRLPKNQRRKITFSIPRTTHQITTLHPRPSAYIRRHLRLKIKISSSEPKNPPPIMSGTVGRDQKRKAKNEQ